MDAWPTTHLPKLPGLGASPRVFDTSTGGLVATPARPAADGPARIYVCGITPYDATHLGHAATYLAFDLVQRAWLDAGYDVRYVQNVTDVDDPLLERAERDQDDWQVLAMRETALFREDMTALRILPPYRYIGAVESIDLVVALVQRLIEQGAAYRVDEDVYFDVHAEPDFGSVSNLDPALREKIFGERGGDPDRPGKRHPLDCLLWQAERPGEPSWETPLGRGRPGWHIECAAIALEYLGAGIDVQGGGSDLSFPHHEMGAAEAQVVTGERPFAYTYVHAGMVGLDGEKMSKSRGNLVFVSKLRAEGHDPMAIRLALLAHHYRADWEWHAEDLERAEARLARWREAVSRPDAPSADPLLAELRERLADDLDAPGALAAMDRWADAVLAGPAADAVADPGAPGLASRALDALLGVAL
ncbi:cysteine--1-D-myo-inosityl 2-amino-2-deoxy-alpha-D-glucopyranoside ligase [Actinospica sp. MGRD01-02]|uniref:L-cysteine:1D-myo-inositol 2-amino-2-deoxy-alpha-D-glucopyranoside ligase n=1 Tax=Actinospica acidithermotolerans TaxID=2828514 RepID=A0A941EBR9_9ACTN|nr:cysteine--1-D-myo-inosityl 2-amino-2-deoxy-alpha-D-glucopyranoside ligase [Actinospica acidithermotolerans]MBR7828362.1 cysteine--1-D-myo-inosityl 2-amino-2-deoxy-alpha-D-glucopyranoside ligase [Actinospica acidithermotolerans]